MILRFGQLRRYPFTGPTAQLGTLAVRGGEFVPGSATEQALNQFTGATVDECATFLSRLSHIAGDDALARAREFGFLPPRPR